MKQIPFLCIWPKDAALDAKGLAIKAKLARLEGQGQMPVHTAKVYSIALDLDEQRLADFAQNCLCDQVLEASTQNTWPSTWSTEGFVLSVAKLPGVTDDEGRSAQTALIDFLNLDTSLNAEQGVFLSQLYYFPQAKSKQQVQSWAQEYIANALVEHLSILPANQVTDFLPFVPSVQLQTQNQSLRVEGLDTMSDEELLKLSKDWVLALNLEEMKAIRNYYLDPETQAQRTDIGILPTDCELEILAQTWSEHCKHKEFNALIKYKNLDTGEEFEVDSLFKTYIKGATSKVEEALKAKGNNWLVKVFSDNAGVVKASKEQLFVWKVETHNSPSALDPYGGAITGILGNNRDPLGTGIGGARLLFNTNVLCFGPPNYDKPLLARQLHPRRIMEGVVAGIEDGGNKSGVPTVNGALVFDDCYSGKPLVYCGTGGLMPYDYQGQASWEKPISVGSRIYMAGGRVGKDGIHGATFSSLEIDESAPASAVQIGSPFTQKKLMDFLIVATRQGLIQSSTDNGAGGLSSSVGELAQISGGAWVDLEKVPLKYSGLKPWEIFVSESQERMTLVVEPHKAQALEALAQEFEVELSDIGVFSNSGFLEVAYNEELVAKLSMHFLHEGTPRKLLFAEWQAPKLPKVELKKEHDYQDLLLQLLGTWNICSKAPIIRRYDHEVKGRTVLKPLMGPQGNAPQDAAVLRLGFDTWEGIAVSNGILPRYGKYNPYQMSAAAFDEGIRQILAVGGQLPNQFEGDDTFWSVNDNFCVPDSVYDPIHNPDGKQKLAQLVQIAQALYDMATFYDIPLTSGKDSMKNDFKSEGQKISVMPTILYSMTAKIADIRKICTAEFKAAGDHIYQLGKSYEELGASELFELWGLESELVPQVRPEEAKALYLKLMQAHRSSLLASCHDLSDGGLAVALAESAFGGQLGATVYLNKFDANLSTEALLFGESQSRFLVSVAPENRQAFEQLFGAMAYYLGEVSQNPLLQVRRQEQLLINCPIENLEVAWSQPLETVL